MELKILLVIALFYCVPCSMSQTNDSNSTDCSSNFITKNLVNSPDSVAYLFYNSKTWDDEDFFGVDAYLWDHFFTIELYENYPAFEGEYEIEYVVDSEGDVVEFCFIRGINPGVDSVMRDAWNNMPNWQPAMKNGKPVTTKGTFVQSYKNEK